MSGDRSSAAPFAIVTGAASGIGLATAERLLADGWAVDRAEGGLHLLQERHPEAAGRLDVAQCDVSDAVAVATGFADWLRNGRALDALVCSAGIIRVGPLDQMRVEDFDALFSINTRGAWLCAKHALPALRATAAPGRPTRIVFISSGAALRPKYGSGAYAASKVALNHLTRVMAVENAAANVLVNSICPATVDTPMIQSFREGTSSGFRLSGVSPLGRIATADDVAGTVSFLLGKEAAYITGINLPVDGGTTAAYVPPGATS